MRFQRIIQLVLLLLFLSLLWLAAFPLPPWVEVDLFLRLDPLIALGTMATARAFVPGLAWALIILGMAFALGRAFCGYICPMGSTLDLGDWLAGSGKRGGRQNSFEKSGRYRNWKYLLLAALAGSSLVGIGYHFLFAPLSIITRFYGLVLYPILWLFSDLFLGIFRPVFQTVGLEGLSFVQVKVPHFSTNLFVALLVLAILALGRLQPRFWCRNLCPAGAMLALCSRRPLFRRIVSDRCNRCGRCVRICPTGAIGEDFKITAHSECIVCLRCREACPESAVSFAFAKPFDAPAREIDLARRKFLGAGAAGVAAAALSITNVDYLHEGVDPRALRSARLIRPPGALPETLFQARCVRCGECVKGCLTNTLQLVWFEAGISGLWTPVVTPRLAGCEQNCNLCGQVCPTGAIRPLDLDERSFAKIGTARVIQSRCIAWEQNKRCLICDEICPYNAISSQFVAGHTVTVPVIDENRCNGCGYCENKCPVIGESAIVVEPIGELRMATGSYREKTRELGLVFHAKPGVEDHSILDAPERPGQWADKPVAPQSVKEAPGLPPGFVMER
ncbi:MAG: 4Fe-4S binding protein [Thermodesulfobacteriota bacterium]